VKLIITEQQEQVIMNAMLAEEFDYGSKRLLVKKFLDDNFMKGNIDVMDDNGSPAKQSVVVMLTQDKKPVKTMDNKQLFYYLQAQFKNILPEEDRDKFIKDTMVAWYEGKLDNNGDIHP
jgi:hypothetical protein